MLDGEAAGALDARAAAEHGGLDGDGPGGQRQRPAVDRGADVREQVVVEEAIEPPSTMVSGL